MFGQDHASTILQISLLIESCVRCPTLDTNDDKQCGYESASPPGTRMQTPGGAWRQTWSEGLSHDGPQSGSGEVVDLQDRGKCSLPVVMIGLLIADCTIRCVN
jgi:hypothetical protein